MACKEYKYKEKRVQINGRQFKAIFVKEHSTVTGLINHTYDNNSWDPYANIIDYRTICYILWKGSKEWKKEYEGKSRGLKVRGKKIGAFDGLYRILFEHENEDIRKAFFKKQEIKDLKKEIKEKSRRLEELIMA